MSGTKDVIDATNLLGQTFKQIQQQKADNERRWAETLQRLSWFVTDAPLYQPVLVPWLFGEDQTANDLMPKSVRMPCERCRMETTGDKETVNTKLIPWAMPSGSAVTVMGVMS